MIKPKKRLDFPKLESIASSVTREAFQRSLLDGHEWITSEQEKNLALGTYVGDDVCVFELCIAAENHNDSLTVSRTTVNRYTGEIIGDIEVYLPPVLTRCMLSPIPRPIREETERKNRKFIPRPSVQTKE